MFFVAPPEQLPSKTKSVGQFSTIAQIKSISKLYASNNSYHTNLDSNHMPEYFVRRDDAPKPGLARYGLCSLMRRTAEIHNSIR